MNAQEFSEWMDGLPLSAKIRALALIYSSLTINSRELFMPERTAGNEKRAQEILHGLNEIHHTLSNSLVSYTIDESKAFPVRVLSEQLLQIENQYRLGKYLSTAIESTRTYMSTKSGSD
jgi:hypothetical protein